MGIKESVDRLLDLDEETRTDDRGFSYVPAAWSGARSAWDRLSTDLRHACDAWTFPERVGGHQKACLKAALDDDSVRPSLLKALGY